MESFEEIFESEHRHHDRVVLAFLLHFLPPPKFDEHFVDECVEAALERLGNDHTTEDDSFDTNTPDLKLLEDDDHAA